MFHTSLWNYDVTGGTSEEAFPELSKLAGKRVGIIGTGATAIQAVPCLAKYAKELYVFQRTPSSVWSRGQKPTDPEEWASSIAGQPGWFDARNVNFAMAMAKCLPEGAPTSCATSGRTSRRTAPSQATPSRGRPAGEGAEVVGGGATSTHSSVLKWHHRLPVPGPAF
ncbi:hypothetical protein NUW58_g10380 [Xylaria curta]|uniref:Uncharacterized protein n=1 Tax=Xylaria curta TaxID=42375 RepID=A0ACC1MN85_9PEZI|nr:hypothetical protein NUW58_g10380 [Xylaria curta]